MAYTDDFGDILRRLKASIEMEETENSEMDDSEPLVRPDDNRLEAINGIENEESALFEDDLADDTDASAEYDEYDEYEEIALSASEDERDSYLPDSEYTDEELEIIDEFEKSDAEYVLSSLDGSIYDDILKTLDTYASDEDGELAKKLEAIDASEPDESEEEELEQFSFDFFPSEVSEEQENDEHSDEIEELLAAETQREEDEEELDEICEGIELVNALGEEEATDSNDLTDMSVLDRLRMIVDGTDAVPFADIADDEISDETDNAEEAEELLKAFAYDEEDKSGEDEDVSVKSVRRAPSVTFVPKPITDDKPKYSPVREYTYRSASGPFGAITMEDRPAEIKTDGRHDEGKRDKLFDKMLSDNMSNADYADFISIRKMKDGTASERRQAEKSEELFTRDASFKDGLLDTLDDKEELEPIAEYAVIESDAEAVAEPFDVSDVADGDVPPTAEPSALSSAAFPDKAVESDPVSELYESEEELRDESEPVEVTALASRRELQFGFADDLDTDVDVREVSIADFELRNEDDTLVIEDEYVSNSQNTAISERYKARKMSLTVRIFTAAFFAILLLFIENSAFFGLDIASAISTSHRSMALLDMFLIVLTASLAPKELWAKLKDLRHGRAYSLAFVPIMSALFVVADALIAIFADGSVPMFGFVAVMGIILLLVCEYFDVCGIACAFAVVSSPGDKLVCELDRATDYERMMLDEPSVMRIKKSGFISSFMKNAGKRTRPDRLNFVLIVSAFVLSLACAIAYPLIFKSFDFIRVLGVFMLAFGLSCPALSLIFRSYSAYSISRRAGEAGSAIIGEGAIHDYSNARKIVFEDVEAYPSSITGTVKIKLVPDCALNDILYYLSNLFRHVGGPLETVFAVAASELGTTENVTLCDASDNGLCASVDDVKVFAGKKEYLTSLGICVPEDDEDIRRKQSDSIGILYVALDGKYCGKFYIHYALDPNFMRRVNIMKRYGIGVAIRTFDPCIDEELVKKTAKRSSFKLTVIKKNAGEVMDFGAKESASALITKYTTAQISGTLILCRKAKRLSRFSLPLKVIMLSAAVLLSGITCAFSLLPSIYSLYVVLYHAFFTMLSAIITKIYLK